MTEPGPRLRTLLAESTTAPPIDHNRLWAGARARQAIRERRRRLVQWSAAGVSAILAAIAIVLSLRPAPIMQMLSGSFSVSPNSRPHLVSADSIQGAGTVTLQTTPSANTMDILLGHRAKIRMDIDQLKVQRRELTANLNNPDLSKAQRELVVRDLADIEKQLVVANRTIDVIDQQISGPPVIIDGEPVRLPPADNLITYAEVAPQPATGFGAGKPMALWMTGTGVSMVLLLTAVVVWVRRATRAARRDLASFRIQNDTQLTALTQGMEAIAVEVERIGENQRFLSKVISAPGEPVAVERQG